MLSLCAKRAGAPVNRAGQARAQYRLSQQQVQNTQLWTSQSRKHQLGCSAYSTRVELQAENEGNDFYSLLGLTPSATTAEIRSAYRQLMRELHPDLLTAAGAEVQQEATTLATLLNQIYQTLTDSEARATYDLLSGFGEAALTALNPFLDPSFERDQVFVDEVTCIGCGKCVRQCPATFEIEASKYGRARVISQTADTPEDIQIAIEVCPISCIYWVSLPQLSLLEAALAVMPRVEVFILQRSGNTAVGNVFEVAYKAFERRRLLAADKARAAAEAADRSQRVKVDWSFWTQREDTSSSGSGSSRGPSPGPDSGQAGAGTPAQRKIAGLAASAARAVRLWQAQGRRVRIKGALADSTSASVDC